MGNNRCSLSSLGHHGVGGRRHPDEFLCFLGTKEEFGQRVDLIKAINSELLPPVNSSVVRAESSLTTGVYLSRSSSAAPALSSTAPRHPAAVCTPPLCLVLSKQGSEAAGDVRTISVLIGYSNTVSCYFNLCESLTFASSTPPHRPTGNCGSGVFALTLYVIASPPTLTKRLV